MLVEFEDGFGSKEIMDLIRREAFGHDGSQKQTIWFIGHHIGRLSMGELPALVDSVAQLPVDRIKNSRTAIVSHHNSTRKLMQLLADGLQHRLPIRCRTFRSLGEAHRWLDYLSTSA